VPPDHRAADELKREGFTVLREFAHNTLAPLLAGDAVLIDYRLLHGTHAKESAIRRECLILTFAPDWSALPDDVRAHLIRHPAQPGPRDAPTAKLARLLPDYDGTPRDLPLSRRAPATFTTDAVAAS
jgi:ectoine hydroxylase-related dioxygenase (phytanoyl-CoA dioxygenase family)